MWWMLSAGMTPDNPTSDPMQLADMTVSVVIW
jgi:hypothetical protein